MYRAPANPATDAIFTTDPCLPMTIAGMNACVQRNVPVAFTASARATAAPIPWPPPVTTATEPSNRGKDCLFEDRPQGLGQACTLVSRRGRRITEVGARPTRFLECSLACC